VQRGVRVSTSLDMSGIGFVAGDAANWTIPIARSAES
jgi:hypothetical protein